MAASESALTVAKVIADAWREGETTHPTSGEPPPIEGVLRRVWLLGAYRSQIACRAQKLSGLDQVERAGQIVEAAASVDDDWPRGFFRFLDDVALRYGRVDSSRLTDRFGSLYSELFNRKWEGAFADLRAAFERYVIERWAGQLAARNRRLTPQIRDEHVWVPVSRASKDLHWRPARLRAVIERGQVRGHLLLRPSGRTSAVIHRDDLASLKVESRERIDLKTVCKRLQVWKKKAKCMMANGTLVPVSGPSVDKHPVWQFGSRDVEKARASLMTDATGRTAASGRC